MADESQKIVRQTRQRDGAVIVDLFGEIDMHRAPELSEALARVTSSRPKKLVLNFTDVKYIDSTGLGTLVYILRQVSAYKGKMAMIGLSPAVRSVFEVTRLLSVFSVHDSEDAAIAAT